MDLKNTPRGDKQVVAPQNREGLWGLHRVRKIKPPTSGLSISEVHAGIKPVHPEVVGEADRQIRSADFPVCCIAGFPTRVAFDEVARPVFVRSADLEIGDTAGCQELDRRSRAIPKKVPLVDAAGKTTANVKEAWAPRWASLLQILRNLMLVNGPNLLAEFLDIGQLRVLGKNQPAAAFLLRHVQIKSLLQCVKNHERSD